MKLRDWVWTASENIWPLNKEQDSLLEKTRAGKSTDCADYCTVHYEWETGNTTRTVCDLMANIITIHHPEKRKNKDIFAEIFNSTWICSMEPSVQYKNRQRLLCYILYCNCKVNLSCSISLNISPMRGQHLMKPWLSTHLCAKYLPNNEKRNYSWENVSSHHLWGTDLRD